MNKFELECLSAVFLVQTVTNGNREGALNYSFRRLNLILNTNISAWADRIKVYLFSSKQTVILQNLNNVQ